MYKHTHKECVNHSCCGSTGWCQYGVFPPMYSLNLASPYNIIPSSSLSRASALIMRPTMIKYIRLHILHQQYMGLYEAQTAGCIYICISQARD